VRDQTAVVDRRGVSPRAHQAAALAGDDARADGYLHGDGRLGAAGDNMSLFGFNLRPLARADRF